MAKKKIQEPKQHTFEVKKFYDEKDKMKEKVHVLIDGKFVYEVDNTLYNGMAKRDNSKDMKAAISKAIKREITEEEYRRAKVLGII